MARDTSGGTNFAALGEGPDFATMTNAWATLASSFLQGATAANRAAVSAMFPGIEACPSGDDAVPSSVPALDHEHLEWNFERSVEDPDNVGVGDTVTFSKRLTEDDVAAFAEISGDTNRLHLDDAFAAETRFGKRIVHGTLVSGLISSALARLPGLTIYLSQDLEFTAPVGIGDRVAARVEIVEALGETTYRLETIVRDEDTGETVVDGEAVVLIDDLPDDAI